MGNLIKFNIKQDIVAPPPTKEIPLRLDSSKSSCFIDGMFDSGNPEIIRGGTHQLDPNYTPNINGNLVCSGKYFPINFVRDYGIPEGTVLIGEKVAHSSPFPVGDELEWEHYIRFFTRSSSMNWEVNSRMQVEEQISLHNKEFIVKNEDIVIETTRGAKIQVRSDGSRDNGTRPYNGEIFDVIFRRKDNNEIIKLTFNGI